MKGSFKDTDKEATIDAKTITIQPAQINSDPSSLMAMYEEQIIDDDQVSLPVYVVSVHRQRFTVETLPDIYVFESTSTELRTCDICGVNELNEVATAEHWEEAHGISHIALKKLSPLEQVERWNQALENYENGIVPDIDQSPYIETSFQASVTGATSYNDTTSSRQDFENELSSVKTEMRDISDTLKQLVSSSVDCSNKLSAIPEVKTAIAEMSTVQAEHSSKIEDLGYAVRKIEQNIGTLQDEVKFNAANQEKNISISVQKIEQDIIALQAGIKTNAENQAKSISTSVQKELGKLENKITAQVQEEIRISVQ